MRTSILRRPLGLLLAAAAFAVASAQAGPAPAASAQAPARPAVAPAAAPAVAAQPAATGKATEATPKRVIPKRCKVHGRVLCADKTARKLYYLTDGKVVRSYAARFGCAATPTREGTFSVQRKSRHHVSSLYHTKMPYAMFFSGGQAVHYSADFAARGYRGCSHGCVNIRAKAGIRWIFDQVRVGDRVVVYRS